MNLVYDIASAEINGTTFVYSTSFYDDGIQVSTLSENGILTPVGVIDDLPGTTLDGAFQLETFSVGAAQFIAMSGFADHGVTVYSLSDSGSYLTYTDAVFQADDPDYNIHRASGIDVVSTSARTFLYAISGESQGISAFEVSSAGGLTNVANIDDTADLQLGGGRTLESFTMGSNIYLLATGSTDDGVSIFKVNQTTGGLTETANLNGSALGILDNPNFGDVAVIGDNAYLYIPEQNGAVTVLEFDGNDITQHQRFASSTNLFGAWSTKVIELGDRLVLSVAAYHSDEVHLFEIDRSPLSATAGGLTHLQTVAHGAAGDPLNQPLDSHPITIDGRTYLLVSSGLGNSLDVYEIGGGDDVVTGINDADHLSGGRGDDLLTGLGGDDEMFGGAGDDDLFGGSGDDLLEGGAGADGILGGSGTDFIRGNDGSDWVRGGSGNDTMTGNDGDDTLRGEDGNDRMFGGNDQDTLAGNAGNDYLRGNNGDDAVYGGSGDDDIGGDAGQDLVYGGLGDDLIRGGGDDDMLSGSRGADTLSGGSGDDLIRGGADADRLIGGTGRDTLEGGSGADVFVFTNVNQSVHGSGRDVITDFQAGVDVVDLSGFSGTLSFVGSYTGAGNEVRYNAGVGRLYLDLDGDNASDFSVDLDGAPALDAGDLIL
jgi:Ca2+-binding RTX toxin-like protein